MATYVILSRLSPQAFADPKEFRKIAELFQKDVRRINEHLQNIYGEGEIDPGATIRKFRIVRREGSRDVEREVEHYNLDAILAGIPGTFGDQRALSQCS